MRQPPSTFTQGFAYQSQFAMFQIAQAAMQQLGGGGAGLLHQMITLVQHHAMATLSQCPGATHAIDATTNDGDIQRAYQKYGMKDAVPLCNRFIPYPTQPAMISSTYKGPS